MGRLPQIMSAGRVSIQAANNSDHIAFPEEKTLPASQDSGGRRKWGRGAASSCRALRSTATRVEQNSAGPRSSLAPSNAVSHIGKESEGQKQ